MKQIVFNHADVSCWVIDQSGCDGDLTPSLVTSIGVVEDGRVLGGVIYHNWTGAGGSVTLHMAGTEGQWASRDFLWCIYDYAFNQMHVKKILGPVPADNERALKIDLQMGFKVEAVLRDAYPDADLLMLSMVREDCRWLKIKPRHIEAGMANLLAPMVME